MISDVAKRKKVSKKFPDRYYVYAAGIKFMGTYNTPPPHHRMEYDGPYAVTYSHIAALHAKNLLLRIVPAAPKPSILGWEWVVTDERMPHHVDL